MSTLSITANPTARRRPVTVSEKKISVDVLSSEIPQSNGEDYKIGNSNDLIHSIRAETIPERSQETMQAKVLPNSTVLPRRARKAATKPEKPRWVTVLRVIFKNLLIFLVIAGVFQLIRRNPDVGLTGIPSDVHEFESRISQVESFLKRTVKLMQIQVEVVDKKIESEVGLLRKKLGGIEQKGVELGSRVDKLSDWSVGLEKAVRDLSGMDLLSKGDFEKFYESLNLAKEDGSGVSLDDVRAVAKGIIEKEIERHAADGIGLVDYALAAGGATVVKHSEPLVSKRGGGWFSVADRIGVHGDSEKMLRPSFGEPGSCFPLKGSSGFVQIRLRTAIVPEAVTLEHVAKSVSYDRSSAPKDCRISGWLQGRDTKVSVVESDTLKMLLLAEFSYDLDKSNAQTYNVLDSEGIGAVDMIRLDFTSNHGSHAHTCIYRLRVHGHEPSSVSLMATNS